MSSLSKIAIRISASSRNATSCASQDSAQCRMPASGAVTNSQGSSGSNGWPSFSASTISALITPTPMKATTRATPNRKVAVILPFHGPIRPSSRATSRPQPRPSAATMPSVGPPGTS